jgi:hypothetical protein
MYLGQEPELLTHEMREFQGITVAKITDRFATDNAFSEIDGIFDCVCSLQTVYISI